MAQPPAHDLAGLEARLAVLIPLETLFVGVYEYAKTHQAALTEQERALMEQAVHSLAMAVDSLGDRPENGAVCR